MLLLFLGSPSQQGNSNGCDCAVARALIMDFSLDTIVTGVVNDARALIGNLRFDLPLCYPELVCVPASFDSISPWSKCMTSC